MKTHVKHEAGTFIMLALLAPYLTPSSTPYISLWQGQFICSLSNSYTSFKTHLPTLGVKFCHAVYFFFI